MEWEQKPTKLSDVADLFPPEMRDSPYILIAGGAAVDLATCGDVDIFFFGPEAQRLWEEWEGWLKTEGYDGEIQQLYPPGDYDPPSTESGYFAGCMTERHRIELPDWGDAIDVILRPGLHPSAKALLNSFDITNCQIGYRLNGECVTGDEFDPHDQFIRLSSSGKRAIDNATRDRLKLITKSRARLDKYSKKLDLNIMRSSYYYGAPR